MLLDFESPYRIQDEENAYKLNIEVYDRDLLTAPKIICKFQLDIYHLVRDSKLTLTKRQLSKKYFDSFLKQNYGHHTERKEESEEKGFKNIASMFKKNPKSKRSQREIESNISFETEVEE